MFVLTSCHTEEAGEIVLFLEDVSVQQAVVTFTTAPKY